MGSAIIPTPAARWYCVTEGVPPVNKEVLIYTAEGLYDVAYRWLRDGEWTSKCASVCVGSQEPREVLYWHPLPTLPPETPRA